MVNHGLKRIIRRPKREVRSVVGALFGQNDSGYGCGIKIHQNETKPLNVKGP